MESEHKKGGWGYWKAITVIVSAMSLYGMVDSCTRSLTERDVAEAESAARISEAENCEPCVEDPDLRAALDMCIIEMQIDGGE